MATDVAHAKAAGIDPQAMNQLNGVGFTPITSLQCIHAPIVCAVALTSQPVAMIAPYGGASGWRLERARYFHQALTAGFAVSGFKVRPGTNEGVVRGNPTFAVSATAERFKTTVAITGYNGTVFVKKAATDNLTFTAAHVITAAKFGIILIELDDDGTVDTRVPASTQAYNSAALALAQLAALKTASLAAGSIPIGYIEIENNTGDWTANTDDLTDASDVTTAAFTNFSDVKVLTGAAVTEWQVIDTFTDAAAFTLTAPAIATAATSPAATATGTSADAIAVLVTTDADGANLNGVLDLYVRPHPLGTD